MTIKNFDEAFDAGESVIERLDLSTATRLNRQTRRVNVDFPARMVDQLDVQAQKRGVTRQALIKMWLADRLEATS